MRILRRYWAQALVILLIPLVIALGWFQLNMIGEIGKRERFRLEQGLNESANQLSRAIQNEVGILSALFVLGHGDIEARLEAGNWSDFQQRLSSWRAWAVDPSIVSGFHILNTGTQGSPWNGRIWLWKDSRFVPDTDQGMGRKLTDAIPDHDPGQGFWITEKLADGTEAFLLPLDSANGYWLVIRIDPVAFTSRLIPQLADRYLSGKSEYVYRIVDQENGKVIYQSEKGISDRDFADTDITYPLLQFGPPFLNDHVGNRMGERSSMPQDRGPHPNALSQDGFPPRPGELPGAKGLNGEPPRMERELPKNNAEALHQSRWIIEAVHRSESLSAAVRAGDLSSGILSLLILIILAVSMIVLVLALRRAQELTERQSEFIASVTHELKTPVAVIQSAADNLEVGLVSSPEQMSRYGTAIKKESRRLSEMIDRLLSYARIKRGQSHEMEIIELGAFIEQILADYESQFKAALFTVERQLEEDVLVPADAAALSLVFGNLIANALKHAGDGKYLSVELRSVLTDPKRGSRSALLRIRDRGPGIPRRDRKRIFEPFYRGSIARNRQIPGSGLGLNIASRIIQSHGGSLKIDTHTTEGTAFLITLPQEQPHA